MCLRTINKDRNTLKNTDTLLTRFERRVQRTAKK